MQTTKHLIKLAEQGDLNAWFQIGYRMAFGREFANSGPWKQIFPFGKLLLKADTYKQCFT